MTNTKTDKDDRQEFWETRASEIKLDDKTTLKDTFQGKLETDWILDNAGSGGRALDVGCGTGWLTVDLTKKFDCVEGIDFSSTMISKANSIKQSKSLDRASFQVADCRKLPFPDKHFDLVVSKRALINLSSWEEQKTALNEIRRVLKSGGVYLMVESTQEGYENISKLRAQLKLEPIKVAWRNLPFKHEELKQFLLSDFQILKEDGMGVYYLLTRAFYPLLVSPEQPRYNSKMNEVAYELGKQLNGSELLNLSPLLHLKLKKN